MRVPAFMYGTAWKEERTEELVRRALATGFRAFDTANQRKHYFEAGVGAALKASGIARSELFLQSKFTYLRGQDCRLPYDPSADIDVQVLQSFDGSLEHLGVDQLDSYLLHAPWSSIGWSAQDRRAWAAMEALHAAGRTRLLGISNVTLAQLEALCATEKVKPAFVQNRCYASNGWDRGVRSFCARQGIVYQAFSLLTRNQSHLALPAVRELASRVGASPAQLMFCVARSLGLLPLTGTSNPVHMAENLASDHIDVSPDEAAWLARLGTELVVA